MVPRRVDGRYFDSRDGFLVSHAEIPEICADVPETFEAISDTNPGAFLRGRRESGPIGCASSAMFAWRRPVFATAARRR